MRKLRSRFSVDAFRQPMRGGPPPTFTPRTASERRGNTVPQKMAKAAPTSTRLLPRKVASRETRESSSCWLRRRSRRLHNSWSEPISTIRINATKSGPVAPMAKEWTELRIPLRVGGRPKSDQGEGNGGRQHLGGAKKRVQPHPLRQRHRKPPEGVGRERYDPQDVAQDAHHYRGDVRDHFVVLLSPLEVDDNHRKQGEDPGPEQERARLPRPPP